MSRRVKMSIFEMLRSRVSIEILTKLKILRHFRVIETCYDSVSQPFSPSGTLLVDKNVRGTPRLKKKMLGEPLG
jgi:hypothetical protein